MYTSVKGIFLFIFLLALVNIWLFVIPRTMQAQSNFSSGTTVTLQKNQTVNEDYFASGQTVIVSGTVNGDVYAAGSTVLINGRVTGDVMAAGGNVSVTGRVDGNVRAAGGQIVIAGNIGKNVTTAGGSIAIEDAAKVAGSLVVAGGNVSVLSPIGKGMSMAVGQVSIAAPIGGNVQGGVQSLNIAPNTRIAGGLTYWSSNKANIPAGTVAKGVTFHQMATSSSTSQRQTGKFVFSGISVLWELVGLVSSFIIGLLLLWFVPRYIESLSGTITARLWLSMGIGFLTVVLVPVVGIFLLITIIGIPIAILLFLAFAFFVLLNKIFVSYAIGKKLLPDKDYLALLVGLIIYGIISIIPIIGWVWSIIALFIGIGALMLVKKDLYVQARLKKLI